MEKGRIRLFFRKDYNTPGPGIRPDEPEKTGPARLLQIIQLEARPGAQQIDAHVPLAEMFGYATDLRSRTQGRGQYTMEPSHYVEIPKNIRDKIVDARNKPQA